MIKKRLVFGTVKNNFFYYIKGDGTKFENIFLNVVGLDCVSGFFTKYGNTWKMAAKLTMNPKGAS